MTQQFAPTEYLQQQRSLDTLRMQTEMAIEMLIALLDALDGDENLEPQCEDEGAQCEDEGDISDSGIGDTDGLMEQVVAINGGLMAGFGASGFARFVE